MTGDQKKVAVGAVIGVLSMLIGVALISRLWPVHAGLDDLASRLVYAFEANLFAALPLLAGILIISNDRFTSQAIDPTLHKEGRAIEINGRVVENTLQQSVLFLVGTLALAANLTPDEMRVIPAAATWFVIARIAFWIGYRIHPLYRAFGMASTGYLNVAIIAAAIWKAVA